MIEPVAAAFERQDYKLAAKLLKPLWQQFPEDPTVQLYVARLQEAIGKFDQADRLYRQLLRDTTNPKIAMQARQGLQQIEAAQQERRQQAIAQATADSDDRAAGVLVIEPIAGAARAEAVRNFAKIMRLDAYTANLQLPSRHWRLYRTGAIGELRVYGEELQRGGIASFWWAIEQIEQIRVFRVQYLQSVSPPTVVCLDENGQLGALKFDWQEVQQRVEGRLPIFEDVVDLDLHKKLQRKEQIRDYAQFCDLHLTRRNLILRFGDSSYQFQQGVVFAAEDQPAKITIRRSWNQMIGYFQSQLPAVPLSSSFTPFAETALEHLNLLSAFPAHIDLFRKAPTEWDRAFQLYSGLAFLQKKGTV
ncbi:tetratricopeptide repeat protein [Microcoleus sp. FACHB-1515]|uniref:tetratricopeptide repeat protein n=1 Tax=Cyanophyceae TaxID=3028117 RepID=UPI001687446B|nr:tetratricopeptide repeat protein [Microcoleus sp. FACHB-1515]MBD2089286.1 tetratricopeptide repeat protein [Microcoleus sp. FACHB-1515]